MDAEGGAFAGLAFDLDPALVSLDQHLGVEEADAHAALLGALEGLEEGLGDELLRHAVAVIGDGKVDVAACLAGGDEDDAFGIDRLFGVEDEVGYHLAYLGDIQAAGRDLAPVLLDGDLHPFFQIHQGLGDQGVQVGLGLFQLDGLAQQREVAAHVVDLMDAALQGALGVGAKIRVLEVHGHVLYGQRQPRNQILQIVYKEGGDILQCLHLLGPALVFGEPQLQDVGGQMSAVGVQQILVLDR